MIHRSNDSDAIWMYRGNEDGVVLFNGRFATGQTPIVIANQVMYRAVEYWSAPSGRPTDFQATIISCDLSKFTIRYDPVSEAHFSLVNPVVSELDPYQRNILSLSYTKDSVNLTEWKILADHLLYDDTGLAEIDSFRYVD